MGSSGRVGLFVPLREDDDDIVIDYMDSEVDDDMIVLVELSYPSRTARLGEWLGVVVGPRHFDNDISSTSLLHGATYEYQVPKQDLEGQSR